MNIYQDLILEHYKHPKNFGKLGKPDKAIVINNPLCGDKFFMEAKVKGGTIENIGFTGEGCAISMASASMLTEHSRGKKISDLKKLDMPFILKMLGIELSPNRLKCALLPLEGLQKLLVSSPT